MQTKYVIYILLSAISVYFLYLSQTLDASEKKGLKGEDKMGDSVDLEALVQV